MEVQVISQKAQTSDFCKFFERDSTMQLNLGCSSGMIKDLLSYV